MKKHKVKYFYTIVCEDEFELPDDFEIDTAVIYWDEMRLHGHNKDIVYVDLLNHPVRKDRSKLSYTLTNSRLSSPDAWDFTNENGEEIYVDAYRG